MYVMLGFLICLFEKQLKQNLRILEGQGENVLENNMLNVSFKNWKMGVMENNLSNDTS